MSMGQAWGENKITGCVCESFRFEFCLNFKRDEEAILKVLNVSSYKIDLTKPTISLNTKGKTGNPMNPIMKRLVPGLTVSPGWYQISNS